MVLLVHCIFLLYLSPELTCPHWRHACGKHAACKQLGVHYMNQTLNICLAAITGKCTKVCLEYIADLLFQISKASFNEFNLAIREQFNQIFLQNEASNANHFQRYLMQMIKERSNKHRFRENIREWSLLCREILGSCWCGEEKTWFDEKSDVMKKLMRWNILKNAYINKIKTRTMAIFYKKLLITIFFHSSILF